MTPSPAAPPGRPDASERSTSRSPPRRLDPLSTQEWHAVAELHAKWDHLKETGRAPALNQTAGTAAAHARTRLRAKSTPPVARINPEAAAL
eukprot:6869718-Alexandrium_andersonii.AAC.1